MGQFKGKTAVITGGSTGIGLATAVRLAEQGAYVFVTGRRKTELDAAVETIGAASVTAVQGDVSVPADLDRLYEAVRGGGQGVDVLFANAGVGIRARWSRPPRSTSTRSSASTSGAWSSPCRRRCRCSTMARRSS